MQVHLDAIGGVAGDMFIAAVLDAFPDLHAGMLAAIRAAGLPSEIACRVVEHRDDVMTGLRFLVEEPSHPAHDHAAHHHHHHTPFREIRMRLEAAPLASSVREHATHIFTLLADVEGKVHGMPAEEVSFHELGGWDSIADMVGAAYLIDALNASAWTVSALPQGSGRVKTEHGWLPVPAPATALLLQGFELIDDGIPGERVTPTGAAILRHIKAEHPSAACGERRPRRLVRTGCGFGTKTFAGLSNVLRLLAFEEAESIHRADRVAQIAFEIDDQTPEDLAIALDRLRAHPAVLDVLQAPAFGKKGRLIAQVRILAQPEDLESVFDACFSETTTLGLRWQLIERRVLPRDQATMEIDGRSIRVKRAQRSGVITAKAESADLLGLKGGRREREAVRKAAEEAGPYSEGDK